MRVSLKVWKIIQFIKRGRWIFRSKSDKTIRKLKGRDSCRLYSYLKDT